MIGATHDETYTKGKGAKARTVTNHYSFQLRGWELVLGGLGAYIAWSFFQNPPWAIGANPATASASAAVNQAQSILDQDLRDGKITQAQYNDYKARIDKANALIGAINGGPLGLIQGIGLVGFLPFLP